MSSAGAQRHGHFSALARRRKASYRDELLERLHGVLAGRTMLRVLNTPSRVTPLSPPALARGMSSVARLRHKS